MTLRNIFLSMLLTVSAIASAAVPSFARPSAECRRWVDSVYNSMPTARRVGQLFVPKFNPAVPATKATITRLVNQYGIGGLLFSKGTAAQHASLTDYAQSLSAVPMLITLDGEWGPAMRVSDAPRFPYNMTLGAIDDPVLLFGYGREVARQCQLLGVSLDFAPVLDVNSNPRNPVIGYRSFGENPQRVAALGVAFAKGLEEGGVMACGKHFPGHGDTSTDSHKTLPTVGHSLAWLETVDLVPFVDFINDGLGSVMVGHLNVPALDGSGTPASLSRAVVTGLLRDRLGFQGLIVTDGLAMKGAAAPDGGNNCVASILAGNDIVLEPLNPEADIKAVIAAVESGKIPQEVLENRVKRVLAAKWSLGLSKTPAPVNSAGLTTRLAAGAPKIIRSLLEASVVCLSNPEGVLPVAAADTVRVAVVEFGGDASAFVASCRKYGKVTAYSGELTADKLAAIRRHDLVIAVVAGDKADPVAVSRLGSKVVKAMLVSPYKLARYKPLESIASLYVGENSRTAQECLAQAVFGGIRVNGTLPVNVEGVGREGTGVGLQKIRLGFSSPEEAGMKASLSQNIDRIIEKCIAEGAFPGCQVLVGRGDKVVFNKNYGYTDRSRSHPVTDATIYDLASVSKAAGMLPGIMAAVDDGLMKVDDRAARYIPGLKDNGKEDITIRDLLLHETGLPSALSMHYLLMDTATYKGRLLSARRTPTHTVKLSAKSWGNSSARLRTDMVRKTPDSEFDRPVANGLWTSAAALDTIRQRIYSSRRRDNRNMVYSDLNFVLLMEAEEQATGRNHRDYLRERIFGPLGAIHTDYLPLETHEAADIAPTEHDTFLRRQTVKGYVHDELAAFSGGVQGNAGLFSNALDLAKLCSMWLNGGRYGGKEILLEETVRLFTSTKSSKSRRRLGFDGADADNPAKSPVPADASASTYGHIGFTGTCFWIDPENDLFFVFLSNRVNPTRDTPAFFRLNPRGEVLQAVYDAIPG